MALNAVPLEDLEDRASVLSWPVTFLWIFVLCASLLGSITLVSVWTEDAESIASMFCYVLWGCLAKAALLTTVICSMD
ncbi:MAG: hypothetical protein P1V97_21135 [Planctomycetota bacterium]|nr:hypothetical protein [Planctomycetota bacterium]